MIVLSPELGLGALLIYEFGPGFDRLDLKPDYTGLLWDVTVDTLMVRVRFDDQIIDVPLSRNTETITLFAHIPGKFLHRVSVEILATMGTVITTPVLRVLGWTDQVRDESFTYRRVIRRA